MLPRVAATILLLICCLLVPAEVTTKSRQRMSDGREICGSVDIRNSVASFSQLENCSVVEGFVQIVLMENARAGDFANVSFPKLVEITHYLLAYRVHGLVSLGALFPNLAVIRGYAPFISFALVVHDMPHLTEVGLWSLKKIVQGSVYVFGNANLCFVDTVNWASLASYGGNRIGQNGDNCPAQQKGCKEACRDCWGRAWREKCGTGSEGAGGCGKLCLGGCTEGRPDHCSVCAGVLSGNVCTQDCPPGSYEFLGRRCVTEMECRQMEVTHPTALDFSSSDYVDKVWWPYNTSCVHSCPMGFDDNRTTGDGGSCRQCHSGKCHRVCNGTIVTNIFLAQVFKGCTYIAGSLEIQIRGRNAVRVLEESMYSIEEIEGYLKVSRSFSLLNLNFFQNLRIIHGKSLDQLKYALVVMDNQDLEDLWDWSSRRHGMKIENGSLFFHYNPKLYYSKIEKLREISGAPNFNNTEVDRKSNGDKMACEIKKIKSYVKAMTSRGAVIEWEPFTDIDKDDLIGYIVYYIEDPRANVTYFHGRDACNSHGWRAIDVTADDGKPSQLLAQLKPFTQYAFYVETYSKKNKGDCSEILYFTTLPDRPSLPTKVISFSNSSSEIVLCWEDPIHPNGILTHYVITGVWQQDNQKFLDYRDYCVNPLESESEDSLPIPSDGKTENQTEHCCASLSEKFEISDKVVFEHMCKSKHLLHSRYIEESHVSNEVDACYNYFHTYMHEDIRLNKTRQELQLVRVGENEWRRYPESSDVDHSQSLGFVNSAENLIDSEDGIVTNFTYFVDAKEHTFTLKNLRHYALYTINLFACRKPLYYLYKNGKNESDYNFCSYASVVNTRTLAEPALDEINFKQMAVDRYNHSLNDVYVSWKQPKRPNGVIVSYQVEYRMVDIENFKPGLECVTRKQHERNGGGYVVRNLSPGNYSFRVRATSLADEGPFTDVIYYRVVEKPGAAGMTKTLIIIFVCLVAFSLVAVSLYFKAVSKIRNGLPLIASVNPDYVSSNGLMYVEDEWEMQRERVTLLQELGQGFFGTVYEGTLDPGKMRCAVKTVSESASPRQMMEFLNEASVMKLFADAHHVVKLLGVVSKGFPPLVVMELMTNGDLKSFLRAARDSSLEEQPSLKQMLLTAAQIADGMAYLGDNKFVHRDLAARNCMVAEDLTVKIGDFGMTRDIYETDYYRNGTKGLLPVRWMAPESLGDGVFTSQSDVWSYGVVLWEMATLAEQPYQGMSNEFVLQHVLAGGSLESPILCPDILRQLMESCWQPKPGKRPTFLDIIGRLERVTQLGAVFQDVSYYCKRESRGKKPAPDAARDESEYVEASVGRPNVLFYHSNDGGEIVAQWKQDGTAPEIEPLLQPADEGYVEHEASKRNSSTVKPDFQVMPNGTTKGCKQNYC
ncbi:insulin receptor-like [Bacillus rossius redtenbacheri]|uniref:insulin receptor-like n=1 Tax=Bacillus rossius redtenbacheri TaxID=93214 RepID=UPI002FDD25C3